MHRARVALDGARCPLRQRRVPIDGTRSISFGPHVPPVHGNHAAREPVPMRQRTQPDGRRHGGVQDAAVRGLPPWTGTPPPPSRGSPWSPWFPRGSPVVSPSTFVLTWRARLCRDRRWASAGHSTEQASCTGALGTTPTLARVPPPRSTTTTLGRAPRRTHRGFRRRSQTRRR